MKKFVVCTTSMLSFVWFSTDMKNLEGASRNFPVPSKADSVLFTKPIGREKQPGEMEEGARGGHQWRTHTNQCWKSPD